MLRQSHDRLLRRFDHALGLVQALRAQFFGFQCQSLQQVGFHEHHSLGG
jgi:hypothetical protein